MAIESIVGLDLSLSRTGACEITRDWGGDVRKCAVSSFATKPTKTAREHDGRLYRIAQFALGARPAPPANSAFYAESVPSHGAFSIGRLSELRGFVMCELYLNQEHLDVLDQRTIRTHFIGPHASKGAKELIRAAVNAIPGAENWNGDECDAFVVANYAAHLSGWPSIRCEYEVVRPARWRAKAKKKARKP